MRAKRISSLLFIYVLCLSSVMSNYQPLVLEPISSILYFLFLCDSNEMFINLSHSILQVPSFFVHIFHLLMSLCCIWVVILIYSTNIYINHLLGAKHCFTYLITSVNTTNTSLPRRSLYLKRLNS